MLVDIGLIGGESVGVTEFRGVKENTMGRRGGVRREGGPAGAGNQEGGEDSLMVVEEEVGVAKHVALVSSHSDQYQKSYGCFSYSVKLSIWRAICSTTAQIEMSLGMMAPDILTAIMSRGFQVTRSISG